MFRGQKKHIDDMIQQLGCMSRSWLEKTRIHIERWMCITCSLEMNDNIASVLWSKYKVFEPPITLSRITTMVAVVLVVSQVFNVSVPNRTAPKNSSEF